MNEHVQNLIDAAMQAYAWGERRGAEGDHVTSSAQHAGAVRMLYTALHEFMPDLPALEDSLPECLTPDECLLRDANTATELGKLTDT